MNEMLSICIPTYNRRDKLKALIEELFKIVFIYKIGIYISDNASIDGTQEMILKYKDEYPFIFYNKNNVNLGAQKNIYKVLSFPTTKYCWLLSDDDIIVSSALESIIAIVSGKNYDLIVINGGDYQQDIMDYKPRVDNVNTQIYKNLDFLVKDIGYHMSWMSVLIFNRDFLKKIHLEDNLESAFPHFLSIFKYFDYNNMNVYWYDKVLVYDGGGDCSYSDKILEYFCNEWEIAVNSINNITSESKRMCLFGIREYIRCFTIKDFMYMRLKGSFNYCIFKKCSGNFKYVTKLSEVILICLSVFPIRILVILKMFKSFWRLK